VGAQKYYLPQASGAGTIFGQGGGKTESAKVGNAKKGFRRIRSLFCPKDKRSPKKRGIRRIREYFCPKNGSGYKYQGGKSRPGGGISPRGAAAPPAPLLSAPMPQA